MCDDLVASGEYPDRASAAASLHTLLTTLRGWPGFDDFEATVTDVSEPDENGAVTVSLDRMPPL